MLQIRSQIKTILSLPKGESVILTGSIENEASNTTRP